jgi:hypothetical protein
MEVQTRSPIDIVQEFITLQNTLKEATVRLQPANGPINTKLAAANSAADEAIAQLMSELSNFGDAVKDSVSKEAAFYDGWNEVVNRLDTLSDEEKSLVFHKMEADLYAIYLAVLREENKLPESLKEALQKQAKQLESRT